MQMLKGEQLLNVVEAVQQAAGVKVHLSTAIRWCQRGSNGIKLESVVLGGRRMTSVAAVQRFMERCTANSDSSVALPATVAD